MRLRQLDVLRGIAIVLVMAHHVDTGKNNLALNHLLEGIFRAPADLWHLPQVLVRNVCRLGWIGVDLFFVLSGFLVSGLLFREHQQVGDIRLARFLVRRGFKIYPPFYVLFVGTVLASLLAHRPINPVAVAAEAIFLQNYGPGLWGHTWSIAVEEHFYLLLGLLLLFLQRHRALHLIWRVFIYVAVAVAALRWLTIWFPALELRSATRPPMQATHLRLDALFYGVVLSYFWHFYRERFAFAENPKVRPLLLAGGVLAFVPGAFFSAPLQYLLMLGLTLHSCGAVLLLIWALTGPRLESRALQASARLLAAIGVYSYSIYLWHVPMITVGVPALGRLLARLVHRPLGSVEELLIYVVGSLAVGVFMAKLIELPALRLRDRLFPSLSR